MFVHDDIAISFFEAVIKLNEAFQAPFPSSFFFFFYYLPLSSRRSGPFFKINYRVLEGGRGEGGL